MTQDSLIAVVDDVLTKFAVGLTDSDDQITSRIAETNASGYGLDEVTVHDAYEVESEDRRIGFSADLHYSGDHDKERGFNGDAISADISGEIAFDGLNWKVVHYELSAKVDDWG